MQGIGLALLWIGHGTGTAKAASGAIFGANHRAGQEAGLEPWEHIGKHWAWKQDRTQQDIFKVCKLDIVVLGHWGMDWTGWQDRFIGGIGLAYKTLSRQE